MRRGASFAVLAVIGVGCRGPRAPAKPRPSGPLVTTGESSGWLRTARYDEAIRLCHDFAATYDGVTCAEIGRTLEDRPIVALRIDRAGVTKPTVYVQAGIHAGEIEGKDAGFWFMRDLLDGKVASGALAAVNVVFVPCLNPDGHERMSPNNRPNQRGPEVMGFRTNSVRTNINRDFVKADTAETAAALSMQRERDPVVLVDLHTTDGAKFQHDIAVLVSPVNPRADKLDEAAAKLSAQLQARLTALGHMPLPFYPSFETDDDPTSGFAVNEPPPRFSQGYAGTRSRLGILVETHSWRTYKERAQSTYHMLQALFERATTDAASWRATELDADRADQALRGTDLPLAYDNGPHVTQIDFRGYAYDKRPSDISGGTWIIYDETKPEIWHVPLRDEMVPAVSARVPVEGYVVDGGWATVVAPVLDRHGIRYARIAPGTKLGVEAFRATKATFEPPYEGRSRAKLEGAWARETRALDDGAIFVSARQTKLRLLVHLLDPAGPDSLAQWGFFAAAFERKEYMESYVAEQAARDMLAADPTLRAKFDADLAADPELAASPAKRLEWFYRRHPAWDERFMLLPIYQVDREPPLAR
jgi:hypothetical protein